MSKQRSWGTLADILLLEMKGSLTVLKLPRVRGDTAGKQIPTHTLSAGQEREGWVLFKDVLIKSIPFYTSRFCSKIQLNHKATEDPNYQREG